MSAIADSPLILAETKRVARLLDIIARISARPKVWTRRALAQAFEISERRLQEDLDIIVHRLRLPLAHCRSGYFFRQATPLPAVTFAFGEAVALLLAAGVGRTTAGVDSAELATALARLEHAFPPELRHLLSHFTSLPTATGQDDHRRQMLELLHEAVATHATVRMRYATASRQDALSEREVDPYALVPYVRSFHLIGFCHTRQEVRIFKVDRIRELHLTGQRFTPPNDFDVAAYLGESWGLMRGAARPPEPVQIRFSPLAGRWVWQQPELALRLRPQWAWAQEVLRALWASNPVLLVMSAVGLVVVVLAASRPRTEHPTFLPALAPVALLLAPTFLWRNAAASNAAYAAAYLTPLIAVLGAAGLLLPYRVLKGKMEQAPNRARRILFAFTIGVVVLATFGLSALQQRDTWLSYGDRIKKINNLQVYIGRWAAQHLPSDATIASREVGAIGYFSERRMVDLGGTIDPQGVSYLRRQGALDTNLLAFLQEVKPSHLAIRPSEIHDLAQRPDILTPATTRQDTDPNTGGVTTLTLYETQWKPASVRALTEAKGHAESGREGRRRRRRG